MDLDLVISRLPLDFQFVAVKNADRNNPPALKIQYNGSKHMQGQDGALQELLDGTGWASAAVETHSKNQTIILYETRDMD